MQRPVLTQRRSGYNVFDPSHNIYDPGPKNSAAASKSPHVSSAMQAYINDPADGSGLRRNASAVRRK
eukprot:3863717-Rhodomonas_salina.4